jgi:predicted ATP-dependent endonuclease of OLD family
VAILKSLTVENFKSIKDPVRINFKPITLLFGPNNAGKSTIIQALQYAREIFINNNLDPQSVVIHGESTDLGGFKAIVHNHDLSLPITLQIELDLGEEKLPDYFREDEIRDQVNDYAGSYLSCLEKVKRVSARVSVRWDAESFRPYAESYRVDLDGEFFCDISGQYPRKSLDALLQEKNDEIRELLRRLCRV